MPDPDAAHLLWSLLQWCSERHQPMTIAVDRETLFAIVAALQLARRHPAFPAATAARVDQVIRDLRSLMPEDLQRLVDMGNDPACDAPVRRDGHF